MPVDSDAGVEDTTPSASDQGTDNASAGSATADNSTSDQSVGTSAEAGSAVAENPTDDGQHGSLKGNIEADAVQAAPPTDWQNQYRQVQGWATKVHQTNQDLQRQLKELQSQFQATQQKTSEPQKQPWDEGHAEHAQFLRLVDKADFYEELIQGENDPEELQKLHAKMHRALGEQGLQTLKDWRTDVRNQDRERRLNPKAYYAKLIRAESEPVVRETLQSTSANYQQMIQARDEAQKWMKENPAVSTPENIRAVLAMMDKGTTFAQATAMIERDHYRNQISNAQKMSASAEEKERLLQGNAAGGIHRNPNAGKKVDVQKLRKDKGIKDSRGFTDMLFDLDKDGLL